MGTKKIIRSAVLFLALTAEAPFLFAQSDPISKPDAGAPATLILTPDDAAAGNFTPTPTPGDNLSNPAATPGSGAAPTDSINAFGMTPTVSPTPTCAAPGAKASSKAGRNYAAWCSADVPGVLFEQDDANNGVSYLVFNSSDKTVDVRIGAMNLVNMDSDLDDGWIRLVPRKQQDLGRLNAYDPNQDWSGGVTTSAQLAK
jgi:hypothetical protein